MIIFYISWTLFFLNGNSPKFINDKYKGFHVRKIKMISNPTNFQTLNLSTIQFNQREEKIW